jgi:hypothetical protein
MVGTAGIEPASKASEASILSIKLCAQSANDWIGFYPIASIRSIQKWPNSWVSWIEAMRLKGIEFRYSIH